MKESFFLIIFMVIIFASCSFEDDTQIPVWKNNTCEEIDSALYNADKSFFVQRYLEYLKTQKWVVDEYPKIQIDDRFFIIVDTILYSKNQKYLFVFYGVGDKGSMSDNRPESSRTLHYACESAIGYRDSVWDSITFYENRLTINSDSFRPAMNAVENYYLKHYKEEWVISSWEKYGYVGYNVDDSLFFDNSLLFQKYDDSLFYFQISIFRSREYKNMPDSVILRKSF